MEDTAFPKATSSEQKSKRPRTIVILVLFLLVLGGILFGASRLLNAKQQEKKDQDAAKAVPTVIIAPSDTPTPSAEPTTAQKKTTPTPTTKQTPTPTKAEKASATDSVDKTSGLDRADLSVEVQNGSGVTGAAAKMGDYLKGLGYAIASTGNADTTEYTNVTIKVKSTKSKYLPLLKKDVAASYTVTASDATLDSGSADALVIVGK